MDINYIAPINQLGYGIVGINLLKALSKQNKVALWIVGQGEAHPKEHSLIMASLANAPMFNVDAPCLRLWHQFDMSMMVGRGLHSGFPIFELDNFNEVEKHHLQSLDHIFVASHWAKTVLTKQGIDARRVTVAPLGVDTEVFRPVPNSALSEKTTTFLNIGKWEVRKGHDILIEAFNKAFEPGDNVALILNCFNPFLIDPQSGEDGNNTWTNLYKNSKLGDKITVIPHRLDTQVEVCALMNSVDAGVFPARAEGWNLELLEMMACGKPVIATNFSAHTEFVNSENCYLIEIENLEDAYDGKWFKGQGQWAELDTNQVDQLIQHMREIHRRKQNGESLFNSPGVKNAEHFSWDATAARITEVFENEGNRNPRPKS